MGDLIRANLARILVRQNGIEPSWQPVSLHCKSAAVPRTLPHMEQRRILCSFFPVAIDQVAIPAAAGKGVTGHKGHHVPHGLNINAFHICGFNDFRFRNGVADGFPKVCDENLIPRFQFCNVSEEICPIPASVSGNDTVGIPSAYGQTGLPQSSGSLGKVTAACSHIDRHFQVQFWDSEYCKNL